jgi:glycosyltransferase involved in cell wall biosynthesis
MTRILQLTRYPTRRPGHGGQLRASNTARVLEAPGYIVDRMAVFARSQYPSAGETPSVDLDTAQIEQRFPEVWQTHDLTTCALAATNESCFLAFADRVQASHPDILMLEEPWLWPAVRRWRDGLSSPPPVIYNAYNIEYRIKAAMLADAEVPAAAVVVDEVAVLERELARSADGISATTMEDASVIEDWTPKKVVVARNGTVLRQVDHLHHILPVQLEPAHSFLLFVGSAHPPNVTGFCELVLPALSVLRSNQRIVVAGSVSHPIQSKVAQLGHFDLGRDRLVLLGQVSEMALSCLLCNAVGLVLPITYGGGSNLKTAEALVSGLPIVGTSIAFRGFEEYVDWAGVTIADEPAAFATGIRGLFEAKREKIVSEPPKELLWERTLQPIIALVGHLAEPASASAWRSRA